MMLAERRSRIWLAQHRVDFRKGHDGLLAEVYKMNLDPFNGDVVLFVGRHRRSIKIIYADPTGIWVSTKKFTVEAMKTSIKFIFEPLCQSITQAELAMLIEGSAYKVGKKVAIYTRTIDVRPDIVQKILTDENSHRNESTFKS